MCTHATSDVDELLHRVSSCEERKFGFKRRIGDVTNGKTPMSA